MYRRCQMLMVGEAMPVGAGDIWEPVISAQLCCQPKTPLKEKVFFFFKHYPEKKSGGGGGGTKPLM